jgi:glycerophosphoryl diester phosphodiesterase
MRAMVVAHRTCPRDAQENSLSGVRAAAALGADAVEIDVRCTRDGVPVLVHDRSLWRIARRPWPVRLMSAKAVRRLHRRDGSEGIVTLEDVLAALPPSLVLAIDIKAPGAAPTTVAQVLGLGMERQVMLWSKNPRALRYCATAAPGVDRALLRDARSSLGVRRFLADARALKVDAISAHWDAVTPAFLDTAHASGLRVYAMSREPADQGRKIALGLDGIVSDWPALARAERDALDSAMDGRNP